MFGFLSIRSIQLRIALWAGLCFLLAAGGIIAYAAVSMHSAALLEAENRAVTSAQFEAANIQAEMETFLNTSRALAQSFASVKAKESPVYLSREQANGMLKQYLLNNPEIVEAYSVWEPDAFDGQDAQYVNSQGSDASGRFTPTWSRGADGTLAVKPNVDYEKEGAGDFYLIPKQTQSEIALSLAYPIQGKNVVVSSLIAPVTVDGKFYGIVGGDMSADALQKLVDQADIYNGSGKLVLISNTGMVMGASGTESWVGKDIHAVYPDWSGSVDTEALLKGQQITRVTDVDVRVFVPVWIGAASQPWTVYLNIPIDVILAQARAEMWRMIAIGAALVFVAQALLWFAARQISRPILHVAQVAQAVAGGDLDVRARVSAEDETGDLADAFNKMIARLKDTLKSEAEQREFMQSMVARYINFMSEVGQNNLAVRVHMAESGRSAHDPMLVLGRQLNGMVDSLQKMIIQIREGADALDQAAAEILTATTQQAAGASEQSSAVAQTSTSVEQIKAITESAIQRAEEVASAAQRNVEVYQGGQQAVQETIESMNLIKQRVEKISQNIQALTRQTRQISQIITTVNEIANQSNLLALNAAVEAARAGEQGRGFAVVADEVRSLAEQSRQATMQVRGILADIQKATASTVQATEEGARGVEDGLKRADVARASILQLSNAITSSAQVATQLSAGGQQQKTGMEQIDLAMQNINQTTLQGLTSTRQAEHSAQGLNELAQKMSEMVGQFRLN